MGMYKSYFTFFFLTFFSFVSCKGSSSNSSLLNKSANPSGSTSNSLSGYIIVANNTGKKNVVLLDPQGNFVRKLIQYNIAGTDTPYDLHIDGEYLYVAVDGAPDRIDRIKYTDSSASVSPYIIDSGLTGNIRAVTQDISKNFLIIESNVLERFTATALRDTSGGFPLTVLTTGVGAFGTTDGGFVVCNASQIRKYNSTGGTVATGAVQASHTFVACKPGAGGKVATIYSGASDAVRVFSSETFATVEYTYSNTSLVGNPSALSVRASGEVLVIDGTYNTMYEINPSGQLNGALESSSITSATAMEVIP